MTLSHFKKLPVSPVIAMVTAVLLISGQVLNCCRLNEALSETFAKAFQSLGIIHAHKAKVASEAEPKSHPNCHGHGSESEVASTGTVTQPVEPGQNQYVAQETCLSEQNFTVNAQPSNPVSFIDLPVQAQIGFIGEFVRLPVQAKRPRPQNKSSPPVYLLTLRILV